MKSDGPWMERRLRISGVLLLLGLFVEAPSLRWSHPTAFLVFLFGGGVFLAAGILVLPVFAVTRWFSFSLRSRKTNPLSQFAHSPGSITWAYKRDSLAPAPPISSLLAILADRASVADRCVVGLQAIFLWALSPACCPLA